jgi:DNA-binding response OmpR family regulator
MQCFLLSRDLMFSSQASGAARAAGCDTKTIGSVEQIDSTKPKLVILDLTMPGLNVSEVVSSLKQIGAKVIAVGPHVHEEKLKVANEAGCDLVLTKGQASRELGSLIGELLR